MDPERSELTRLLLESDQRLKGSELLELALHYSAPGTDVGELVEELMQSTGALGAAAEALSQRKGVPEHTVLFFRLLCRFSSNRDRMGPENLLDEPGKWADYLWPYFYRQRQERLLVLGLGELGELRFCEQMEQGGDSFVNLDLNQLCTLLRHSQSRAVVLAHNHPSGLAVPSQSDIQFTLECARALEDMGVRLADHLVFTDDECVSFMDSRMLTKPEE